MERFGKAYYDRVFPGIGLHRHDYAADRAEWLIQKYGTVRFLDVGCGCGILVKELNQRGATATGLERSAYAVRNSCAPDHVVRGNVRWMPFADGAFDVVVSNGVLGYFPLSAVGQVIAECRRVGRFQEHNIDFEEYPEHGYRFVKDESWWRRQWNA
jgi:SAM-dependent methyltransferase